MTSSTTYQKLGPSMSSSQKESSTQLFRSPLVQKYDFKNRRFLGFLPGPKKVEKAAQNALVGNVEEVARQVVDRFHPEDRLMLWFDFFNHDNERVTANMRAFMERVAPRVQELLGR